jgi:hypothetical protein
MLISIQRNAAEIAPFGLLADCWSLQDKLNLISPRVTSLFFQQNLSLKNVDGE